MANSLIPVADAPVFDTKAFGRLATDRASWPAETRLGGRGRLPSRSILAALIVWTLIHFTAFGFLDGKEPWQFVLIWMRYMLWPAIGGAFLFHLATRGNTDVFRVLRYFLPFLVIGILCSLVGFSPSSSLRLVFFWTLGVIAATTIGLEVRAEVIRPTLFWTFFGFVAASILFVIFVPKLGIMADNRVESGGAWRGLFPGKNVTGLICAYALIMAWFTRRPGKLLRIVCAIAAAVTMAFADSQGAIVTIVLVAEYVVLVGMLRRGSLSAGVQATILAVATSLTVLILLFGASFLLELLGRDPSLTGRTEIWAAFLTRASYFWLTGAGPGSFSLNFSPVTADLTHLFVRYGNINSPHNMFIAAFGELGIFGFIAYVSPLFYFAFVLPCVKREPAVLPVATVAFTMVIGGITETREVFGLGMNMFLLVLMLAIACREDIEREMPADDEHRDGVSADTAPVEMWTGPRLLG